MEFLFIFNQLIITELRETREFIWNIYRNILTLYEIKNTMFEEVEQTVCEVFGIEYRKLYDRDARKIVSNARSIVWYVLHCDNEVSISALSKRYGRTERNIKYMIARIRFLIGRDRDVTNKYYSVRRML